MQAGSYMTGRKMLVLGATGGTGREILSQALQQGHKVTAVVRRPEQDAGLPGGVRILRGTVTDDTEALDAAVRGQEVVISTLGVGKALRSGGLIARSAPLIVGAMNRQGIRRLILMSAYGVGATWKDVPILPRMLMGLLLRDLYTDKEIGEEAVRRSDLDWTLVYPVTLTNGPRTGRYRVGERLRLRGFPTISRADVAEFILTQIEDRSYLRKGVLISS
jgi:putative NADH-flavin reductase